MNYNSSIEYIQNLEMKVRDISMMKIDINNEICALEQQLRRAIGSFVLSLFGSNKNVDVTVSVIRDKYMN